MTDGRATAYTAWGRVIDYLFGRNALIGVASLLLLLISGYATWVGMTDFIVGVQSEGAVDQARDIGGLSVTNEVLITLVVITLTFLMWLALRETFGAQRRWSERLITFPLYIFLLLWSVGFGYGFWWSLIAGTEATRTSLAALQEDARAAGGSVSARLDAVQVQLDSVVAWSETQMQREETTGGSCGRPSGAGRGPLYAAREGVRDSVASVRQSIAQSWITPVQQDITELRQSATNLSGETFAERQRAFEQRAQDIRSRARSIAARSNELGASYAAEMRALASVVSIPPGKAGFSCYDPTLAERLRQAADQADEPVVLNLRTAEFTEGPAGVANAIRQLWTNIGAYLSGLIELVASGFALPENGADSAPAGLTGRDLIALLAAIGVDLGLFALMVLNPPATPPTRRDALAASQARLHMPTATVVRQLSAALETAIARAPDADLEWVRRHLVHHRGTSYLVIPNLYSCQDDRNEELRALAMNQLAGVLDDLKLVVALTENELRAFGKEEQRSSFTDLGPYRDEWREQHGPRAKPAPEEVPPLQRNHGLLSKAERALDIAGWSDYAKRDVEIYKLVDTEGLTPLLVLLNEATLEKGKESAQAATEEYEAANNRREENRGKLSGDVAGLIDRKPDS